MLGKITLTKNNGGGGGGGANLNVFAQNTEPTTTEGVWIDTSGTGSLPNYNTFNYEGIECNDYKYGDHLRIMPMTELKIKQATTPIYFDPMKSILFRLDTSFFAYSIIDGATTNLADIPIDTSSITTTTDAFCIVGELIYYIRGTSLCVYNYIHDEWTTLANRPVTFGGGGVNGLIQVGDELYTFGANLSNIGTCAYKYNITQDEWTPLTNPPDSINSSTLIVNNQSDVFMIKGTNLYKYNILTNNYTTLASAPSTLESCRIYHLIGDYIYVCAGQNAYKYDIVNNIWSEISKFYTSINANRGVSCVLDSNLYTVYHNENGAHIYKYDAGEDRWETIFDLSRVYLREATVNTHAIVLYPSSDILILDEWIACKLTPAHTKQNYIYLKTENTGMDAKISNELTAKISGSLICTSTGLYKYPTYVGADDSWHLLPS